MKQYTVKISINSQFIFIKFIDRLTILMGSFFIYRSKPMFKLSYKEIE